MNRAEIVKRVQSIARDYTKSIFREVDIIDFINEAVDRFKQRIPELKNMVYLATTTQTPILLPSQYHNLLAIYAASRCFFQDERHYQATTLMNEFEVKLDELKVAIENGEIIITDEAGTAVTTDLDNDYVVDNYFRDNSGSVNNDESTLDLDSEVDPVTAAWLQYLSDRIEELG